MAIKESALAAITSIAQTDFVRMVTSAGASRRATLANIAKAIIENYTGSSLGGSTQSVKAAVDSVSSNFIAVTGSGGYSSETTTSALKTAYNALPGNCIRIGTLTSGDFGGIIVVKASNDYGVIVRIGYGTNTAAALVRSLTISGGTWGSWVTMH